MLFVYNLIAQDTVQHIAFGSQGADVGVRAIPTDSNLFLFGSTGGVGAGQSDIYIIKLDSAFGVLDFVPIGTHGIETLKCVEYDSNSNLFVLAAIVYDGYTASDYEVQLYIVNEDLELLRTRRLNNVGNDDAVSLSLTSSEISVFIDRQIEEDLYKHARFDYDLDLIDDFELRIDSFHLADHVLLDNEIHILGDGFPLDSNERNIFHLKMNFGGEIVSEASLGLQNSEIASQLMLMNDSTWLFTGSTNSFESEGDYDAYLAKVDTADSVIWQISMGHSTTVTNRDDYGIESFEHPDGSIYTGMSTLTFGQPLDFHLYQYSSNGIYINGTSFGLEKDETLASVHFLADSSYLMFGTTNSFGIGQEDFILVHTRSAKKTTNLGYSEIQDDVNSSNQAAGIDFQASSEDITVTCHSDNWQVDLDRKFYGNLVVYNLVGQILFDEQIQGESQLQIPVFLKAQILELTDFKTKKKRVLKLVR